MNRVILPRFREVGSRYVQIARAGQAKEAGYEILDDSTAPQRMHMRGTKWRLSDEMLHAGTVPQTSISLYGAYEHTEDEFAAPRFGHPKDRRPDLKQVRAGLAVTGDGGVPVFHRGYDGGAGEIAQVVGAMTALRQIAGPREFLLVGDSTLVSYNNLAAMIAAGVGFVAPASKTYVPATVLADLDLNTAAEVDYLAERDTGKPADTRGRWRVVEDTMTVSGPRVNERYDVVVGVAR